MEDPEPPLHTAVTDDNLYKIKKLLAEGHDPNEIWQGEAPLHITARLGYVRAAEALLQNSASIDMLTKHRREPAMYLASRKNHLGIVKLLVKHGSELHGQMSPGMAALQVASRNGSVEIVEYLLSVGVNKDGSCPSRQTPLTVACQFGKRKVAECLLAAGCDVDLKDELGYTPLFSSVTNHFLTLTKLLLQHHAKTNVFNEEHKMVPLHAAILSQDPDIAKALLNSNCDVNAVNGEGQTALYMAAELGVSKIVDDLLDYGANADLVTEKVPYSPLFAAVSLPVLVLYVNANKPIEDIVRLLVQGGCDVNMVNPFGQTTFQVALDKGLWKVAVLLLHVGCGLPWESWLEYKRDCTFELLLVDKHIEPEKELLELQDTIAFHLKNPKSLKMQCRNTYRNVMCTYWPYRHRVNRLPLPRAMKDFLLYKDI